MYRNVLIGVLSSLCLPVVGSISFAQVPGLSRAEGIVRTNQALAFSQLLNQSQTQDGDACEVTSGPNKGKKGVYTDGGTWCEGTWGGTECTDQQGNSKCQPAAVAPTTAGTRGVLTTDRAMWVAYADATAPGASRDALEGWITKYNVRIVSRTASQLTVTASGKTLTIDGNLKNLATVRR